MQNQNPSQTNQGARLATVAVATVVGIGVVSLVAGCWQTAIPVANSLEAAEREYEQARSSSQTSFRAVQEAALKLASVDSAPESLTTYLDECLTELRRLRDAYDLQKEQKGVLAARTEEALAAWAATIERLESAAHKAREENRLIAAKLKYRQALREADAELDNLAVAIRKGRDLELLAESAKHRAAAQESTAALQALADEMARKARSFRRQTEDLLAAWL